MDDIDFLKSVVKIFNTKTLNLIYNLEHTIDIKHDKMISKLRYDIKTLSGLHRISDIETYYRCIGYQIVNIRLKQKNDIQYLNDVKKMYEDMICLISRYDIVCGNFVYKKLFDTSTTISPETPYEEYDTEKTDHHLVSLNSATKLILGMSNLFDDKYITNTAENNSLDMAKIISKVMRKDNTKSRDDKIGYESPSLVSNLFEIPMEPFEGHHCLEQCGIPKQDNHLSCISWAVKDPNFEDKFDYCQALVFINTKSTKNTKNTKNINNNRDCNEVAYDMIKTINMNNKQSLDVIETIGSYIRYIEPIYVNTDIEINILKRFIVEEFLSLLNNIARIGYTYERS